MNTLKLKLKTEPIAESPKSDSGEKRVLSELVRLHLPPEQYPSGVGEDVFPNNIVEVPDTELGRLHSVFTALACYAESQTALSDSRLVYAESELEYIRSVLHLRRSGEKVADAKARVNIDPQFLEAQRTYLYCHSLYKLTRSKLESFNRKCQCISREITRRSQELPNFVRSEKT